MASLLSPRWLGVLAAAGIVLSSSRADANGRFPESNQIQFSAADPDLILLRVTFGLLVSHDRGKTFQWACEQAIGFSGVEDPMYTITPSRSFLASTFQGVSISRDQGCGWSYAGGELANQVFIDLSANPKDTKNIVVFASSYDKQDDAGNILFTSKVWETKDEGLSFSQLGGGLDPALLGYTIDLTSTDPNRIYATAVRNPGNAPKAFLLTSRNHGQSWEEVEVPLQNTERSVFVAAVDPNDAEKVYLRTSNGVDKPSRVILREAPSGGSATFRTIYTGEGGLPGFALNADGSKVYVGGPRDGVRVASTSDFAFQQRSTIEVQCLTVNADGVWACSTERSGFIAGLSKDDGATFSPVLRFCEIQGPLTCAAGTPAADQCNSLWPSQKALLGCDGSDAGAQADSSVADAGSPKPGGGSTSSCGCRTTPAGPWGALVTVFGAAAALVRRARRRAR